LFQDSDAPLVTESYPTDYHHYHNTSSASSSININNNSTNPGLSQRQLLNAFPFSLPNFDINQLAPLPISGSIMIISGS
jgi:hypothetical protein